MTTYYSEHGVVMHRDSATTTEAAMKVLEEKNLCVAIIDNDGELECIKYGEYKETVLLYNGKVYLM